MAWRWTSDKSLSEQVAAYIDACTRHSAMWGVLDTVKASVKWMYKKLLFFSSVVLPALYHYSDVKMSAMVSQITSLTIVYSTICLDADQRKHQSSTSLAFVTRKKFPFDDVFMMALPALCINQCRKNPYGVSPSCMKIDWWSCQCSIQQVTVSIVLSTARAPFISISDELVVIFQAKAGLPGLPTKRWYLKTINHHSNVMMGAMTSQITGVLIVCSTVCSDADQRDIKAPRHWPLWEEIHRSPVNSPHEGPVMRKMFPFDGVIMHQIDGLVQERRNSRALVMNCSCDIRGVSLEC